MTYALCRTLGPYSANSLDMNLTIYFSNEVLTKGPGEIIVENYGPIESRLWEVQAPKKSKIMLQFDKEFGFQVEYHRRCFYDKARVYSMSTNSNILVTSFLSLTRLSHNP